MNRTLINGSALNGAGLAAGVVSAFAAIACAVTIAAVGTRQQDALAPTYSDADVVADALVARMATASLSGTGDLEPHASHVWSVQAHLTAGVDLQAFVLREIKGGASIHGTAELVVIPAGVLADADLAGSAAVLADATKVQPGKVEIDASGEIAPIGAALVTRYVQADLIGGGAEIRVETTIEDVSEAYSAPHATAELSVIGAGLVTKYGAATLDAGTLASADATQIQPGKSDSLGVGMVLLAEPNIEQLPFAFVGGQASTVAMATRVLKPEASAVADASIGARASQRHGSTRGELSGNAQLAAAGAVTRSAGRVDLRAGVALQVEGLRTVLPQAHAACQADLAPTVTRTVFADPITLASHAELDTQADQTVRAGVAQVAGDAQVTTGPVRIAYVRATVVGHADFEAMSTVTMYGFISIVGTASIEADTRMNMASLDPPSRTFYRPAMQTEFMRAPRQTDFRRVA